MAIDPLSATDRVAALLRQRLLERARENAETASTATKGSRGHIDVVQPPAAAGPKDERQKRRAIIETILAQELGGSTSNDPRFQQLVDQVFVVIERDSGSSALLTRAAGAMLGTT